MIKETTENINIFIDIQEYVLFFNLKGTSLKRHIGMTNTCVVMHHLLNDNETQEDKKLTFNSHCYQMVG